MLKNVTECIWFIYGLHESLTECRCAVHVMLWNVEAAIPECYEIIYQLIQASKFLNILLKFYTIN